MDRVRFAIGTPHVFQGYDDGVCDMVGANVLVTADTLREVVQHIREDINGSPFDLEFNAPEPELEALSFGAGEKVAPDGMTPLYRIVSFGATIVQRYDPELPAGGGGWKGRWVNEEAIDAFHGGWDGMKPGTFEPVCHGFVISRRNVAEGRGDSPLIETVADRQAAEATIEAAAQPYVSSVVVTLNTGATFHMDMDEGEQSGTSFDNGLPRSALELEGDILDAIQNRGLNPVR